MITIYLDHNLIDKFDRGDNTYLKPILADKECLPIVSLISIDEIFRGGDQNRSKINIESLKKLGVKYIHSGPDESHMLISELDYENMYNKWLEMQIDIGSLNNSHFLFINETQALQDIESAFSTEIDWMKKNYDKFPHLQKQMANVLKNPEEYKELCKHLIVLKKLLPFKSIELNNMSEKSVFRDCVDKLKNSPDQNLNIIADEIENAIESAKTIDDKLMFVLTWLNFFGYYPDNLTRIEKIKSNFSDILHSTYGVACDGILTLDKKFAKKIAVAINALGLKTEIDTDANKLLQRIAMK